MEKNKEENQNNPLKKMTSLVLRLSGIIFFIVTLIFVVEVLQVNFSTFAYIMDKGEKKWSFFFIISSLLYTSQFLFSLFATGTAAIFAGKNGYTQSVWNCQIYSVVMLALYTSLQLITGLESEMQFILVTSIVMQLIYAVIILVCLKEVPEFSFKDIRPKDPNSKLCLRVYLIMLTLMEIGCFIWANKTLSAL
ncbi:MAG: hypothetical protein K6E78_03375 [Treponema sp.]|nr:hypothetical protein [Treponema sp.]